MKKLILFSKVDKEDYWISSGISFEVENTEAYEDSYLELKEKLESEEIINFIIESRYIDKTMTFNQTYWDYALIYQFLDVNGEPFEYKFSADYITYFH